MHLLSMGALIINIPLLQILYPSHPRPLPYSSLTPSSAPSCHPAPPSTPLNLHFDDPKHLFVGQVDAGYLRYFQIMIKISNIFFSLFFLQSLFMNPSSLVRYHYHRIFLWRYCTTTLPLEILYHYPSFGDTVPLPYLWRYRTTTTEIFLCCHVFPYL